jgi:hypothetical protein
MQARLLTWLPADKIVGGVPAKEVGNVRLLIPPYLSRRASLFCYYQSIYVRPEVQRES